MCTLGTTRYLYGYRSESQKSHWDSGAGKWCNFRAPAWMPLHLSNAGYLWRLETHLQYRSPVRVRITDRVWSHKAYRHWFWERHASWITTGHQHDCLNIFPVWATLGDGQLRCSTKILFSFTLGSETQKTYNHGTLGLERTHQEDQGRIPTMPLGTVGLE